MTIDVRTMRSTPRQKEAAVGIPGAQEWVNDLPNEQNKRFVADYRKSIPAYRPPSTERRLTTPQC